MKSKLYSLLAVLFTLVLQNCQDNAIEKAPEPTELISKISVADEKKLLQGLDYMLAKTSSGARVNQSKINKLKLDSVIRRIDPKTGSTNYSFFIEENRPYSVANLVVTENKGAYLAFLVEYISSDPKKGWDLGNFQGKMLLTTIDGKNERIIQINPPKDKGGRADGAICSTTVWRITASSEWGSSTYYETETSCYFIDVFDGSYGELNDTGNNVTPGMTGINDNGTSSEPEFEFPGIDKTAINISSYINCFGLNDNSATYRLTIYVEEPLPGSDYQKVGLGVGHTFVGLTKFKNGQETTQHFGFYPAEKTLIYPTDSKIVNNQETEWTTSVTFEIDADSFNDALYAANDNSYRQYHISQYNCTTYALSICDASGVSLPKGTSEFPYGYGSGYSPGKLGYDLRNSGDIPGGTKNFSGGTTPNSKGPCQ
jgi:hypothetical protein